MPFLKSNSHPNIKDRAPDQPDDSQDSGQAEAIQPSMQTFLQAIQANDPQGMAQALVDAHDIMHSTMDQEAPEPHSYDAQNQEAGE